MTTTKEEKEILDEETLEKEEEAPKVPPIAKKVTRFGPQSVGKFGGKGAMNFNPPNKQRPGRAAGRGR